MECKQKLYEDKKRRDEQIRANFAKARAAVSFCVGSI